MAIMARWRMPPEILEGVAVDRLFRDGNLHLLQKFDIASARACALLILV